MDNSLIVTAVDCAAAELAVNWIKSLESNLVPCYLVIAMDGPSYTALQLHVPADRLVIAPPNMRAEAGGAYAGQDSRDFRKVCRLFRLCFSACSSAIGGRVFQANGEGTVLLLYGSQLAQTNMIQETQ